MINDKKRNTMLVFFFFFTRNILNLQLRRGVAATRHGSGGGIYARAHGTSTLCFLPTIVTSYRDKKSGTLIWIQNRLSAAQPIDKSIPDLGVEFQRNNVDSHTVMCFFFTVFLSPPGHTQTHDAAVTSTVPRYALPSSGHNNHFLSPFRTNTGRRLFSTAIQMNIARKRKRPVWYTAIIRSCVRVRAYGRVVVCRSVTTTTTTRFRVFSIATPATTAAVRRTTEHNTCPPAVDPGPVDGERVRRRQFITLLLAASFTRWIRSAYTIENSVPNARPEK